MELAGLWPRQQGEAGTFDPAFLAETRAPHMLVGNILMQSIGTILFFMRVYCRLALSKSWRREDYVLTMAWASATSWSVCQYGQIYFGAGRHLVVLLNKDPQDFVTGSKYSFASQIAVFPSLALPKLSICLAYLRIFFSDTKGRYVMHMIIAVLILAIIPFQIETILQCKPIHSFWTENRPDSKCIKDIAAFYTCGVTNILVDIAIMALVVPRIMKLHLHKRQRHALLGIVFLGTLAVIAGIVRLTRIGILISGPDVDSTWESFDITIWTATEIYVSLACASAPGIKPLMKRIMPGLLSTSPPNITPPTDCLPGQSYELRSQSKHTATATAKNQPHSSETELAGYTRSSTEFGRSEDAESLGDTFVPDTWKALGRNT